MIVLLILLESALAGKIMSKIMIMSTRMAAMPPYIPLFAFASS